MIILNSTHLKSILFLLTLMVTLAPVTVSAAQEEGNRTYAVFSGGLYDDFVDDHVLGTSFQIGYDFSRYFAVEGHFGFTVENDDTIEGVRVEKQLLHSSVVLRGNLRGESYAIFLFAGQSYVNLDFELKSPASGSDNIDESDLTYGIGMDLYGSENLAITVKWHRLIDIDGEEGEEDGEIDAAFIGLTYYFGDYQTPVWY